MRIVKQADLPWSAIAHELVGADHGAGVCVIFVDAEPGQGPRLHRHPYEEIFVTPEGQATLRDGETELVVGPGDVAVVPAGEPHGFVNSGAGRLRQIDIHVSPSFSTEWLER
jgi:mannose-6-phosphate isomerase-like protein (cupin superfamily)